MSEQLLYAMHASLCQTLGNPKRLEIIHHLRSGEKSVSALAEAMAIGQSNLSQHLAVMRQKGIVMPRRAGSSVYYRLSNAKIIRACDLMRQVLLEQLQAGAELTESAGSQREQK